MAARSCPKCGSTKIEGDECLHCGIYISKYLAYLARGGPAQVAPTASAVGHMAAVPFKVYGAEMQFVELELATGVAAVAEAGSMMYMEDGIAMTTAVGDGAQAGVVGAVLSAGKRMLAGESLFITVFSNTAALPRKVAFVAAARGVSIGIAFQKRLGVGFFGGQGFIMERLEGDGVVFVNTGGSTYERTLAPGEVLNAEAGSIVA